MLTVARPAEVVVVINPVISKKNLMKKICLSVVGIILTLFSAFAQPAVKDSSEYKSRKLTFEEANLVSSYYRQDGNNSAVTGGIGT